MRIPTIPWVGYTLLRLTAVLFLSWALVAQFIALSGDMKEYSRVKGEVSGQASNLNGSTPASIAAFTSSGGTLSTPSLGDEYTGVSVASLGSRTLSTLATASATASATTATTATGTPTTTVDDDSTSTTASVITIKGVIATDGTATRFPVRRLQKWKRDDEDEDSYYGKSGVPNHPGGAFFAVISRLLMAFTAFALIFVQIGVPEEWLYNHVPWLGPQSTPISLGAIQLILAIETLQIHATPSVLMPSWAIFAIGLVNVIFGIVMWLYGRKLPRDPPPPLYFAKSSRLLYWTPLPNIYRQLDPVYPDHPTDRILNGPIRRLDPDKEKALPPSDALEIGLEYSDAETDAHARHYGPGQDDYLDPGYQDLPEHDQRRVREGERLRDKAVRTRPSEEYNPEKDVRQGGYPTFTGHGVTEVGRNVPAGHVEVRGERFQFTTEDEERGIQQQKATLPLNVRPEQRETQAVSGQVSTDVPSKERRRRRKGEEKKASLAPLDLHGSVMLQGTGLLRLPPTRGSTIDMLKETTQLHHPKNEDRPPSKPVIPTRSLTAPGTRPRNPSRTQVPVMSPIKEGARSAQATPVSIHTPTPDTSSLISYAQESIQSLHSLDVATKEFGPCFPLPPSQVAPGKAKSATVTEAARARRESSVDSMAGAGRSYAALTLRPDSAISEDAKAVILKMKYTQVPSSKGPSLNVPGPPSRDPSPTKPKVPSYHPPSLRSSLASESRPPSTESARLSRVARRVRFDGFSPATPTTDTRRSSVLLPQDYRVSQTNTTRALPLVPGTPKPTQPQSPSSSDLSSDEDDDDDGGLSSASSDSPEDEAARPESLASTASFDTQLSAAIVIPPPLQPRECGSSLGIDVESMSSVELSSRRTSEEKAGLPRRDSVVSPKTVSLSQKVNESRRRISARPASPSQAKEK